MSRSTSCDQLANISTNKPVSSAPAIAVVVVLRAAPVRVRDTKLSWSHKGRTRPNWKRERCRMIFLENRRRLVTTGHWHEREGRRPEMNAQIAADEHSRPWH